MIFKGNRIKAAAKSPGFSLVELLCIIAILAIVFALATPVFQSLAAGAGRKGAVRMLMNALEEARVTALERSAPVYLGFAERSFAEPAWRYKRFILFRERDPATDPETSPRYIPLSKWVELPQGISIKSEESSVVGSNTGGAITIGASQGFPGMPAGGNLACVKFNSLGAVELPLPNHPEHLLQIFIYEGHFANERDNFTRSSLYSAEALFDKIVISRFSGRARLVLDTTKI